MVGQTLGHYRILEKIGAGGMGVVYRAHDERLDRDVALKVLPAGTLADEAARKRFRKEALALSKLNHPNIETVHDFDSQDGTDFLVMEYIPGVTLSDKLAGGPLPEKEILRIGTQLAEGLSAAHEQNIIHRDLKPGNLRITPEGRLKILDFGLAKLVQPFSDAGLTESVTETRSVAGTLPYMAPEQLQGTPVDARTDIYAAGTVLYEMATGQLPFQEKLSTSLADAILHKPAPPPGRLKTDLSSRLEEIILKCMEKEPDNRYQSAKELLVDLRRLSSHEVPRVAPRRGGLLQKPTAALVGVLALMIFAAAGYFTWRHFWPSAKPSAGKMMLAVLPFENLSGDPEQEYFSDGLTEEMIVQLGSLQPQRLGVIARTSVMHYKKTGKSVDQIGRELGVAYVLEGSVRKAGTRVRVTAQLIQVSDQTHLWAESYEREMAGIFAVQSEVSQRVARSLAVELLPGRQEYMARPATTNPRAYEAYLQGRFYWNKRTREATLKGLEYFQQAVELDPNYAQGYAGLADSYAVLGVNGLLPPGDVFPKGMEAVRKALELDPDLAEAHTSHALLVMGRDWDWARAEHEFQRAIELAPGYATAHQWYGFLLGIVGRGEDNQREYALARQLDPVSTAIGRNLAMGLCTTGEWEHGIEEMRKVIDLAPDDPTSHSTLARCYLVREQYGPAIEESEKARALENSHWYVASLGHAYAVAGRRSDALKALEELREMSRKVYVPASWFALVYVGLGDKDQAFQWQEKAFRQRDPRLLLLLRDSRIAPLRSDPRFRDLMRRLNLPE